MRDDPLSDISNPINGSSASRTSTQLTIEDRFRMVLGEYCTGIAVITGWDLDGPTGITCQSFTSLSLDPPLVAFCVRRQSTCYARIKSSGSFCVNVLDQSQQALSQRFASSQFDKFAGLSWHKAPSGSPILDGVLAWLDCRIEMEHDGGDHFIVVGRVEHLWTSASGDPLLYHRGNYRRFDNQQIESTERHYLLEDLDPTAFLDGGFSLLTGDCPFINTPDGSPEMRTY